MSLGLQEPKLAREGLKNDFPMGGSFHLRMDTPMEKSSVNLSLARGLRTRLVREIETVYDRFNKMMNSKRRLAPPQTHKGVRRIHKEYLKLFAPITIYALATPGEDRYGVWLCWDSSEMRDIPAVSPEDAIHVRAVTIDYLTGYERVLRLPVRVRGHALERLFQRVGVVDTAAILNEIVPAMLVGGLLGQTFSIVRTLDPTYDNAFDPLLIPTRTGALLGDFENGSVVLNTYVGGTRELTPAKQELCARIAAWRDETTIERMFNLLVGLMIGLAFPEIGRNRDSMDDALFSSYGELLNYLLILDQTARGLRPKDERANAMQKLDLEWARARDQDKQERDGEN